MSFDYRRMRLILTITYYPPAPLRSHLRPPKLAPSAWQLYFAEWIQRHQAATSEKLNVAYAAKEAGREFANLSPKAKEVSTYTRIHRLNLI